ncbi:MAG: monooxygenase family protein [Gemmatimonadaceae bacterium]
MGFGVIVQYWRSFEHLESYARSKDQQHWPAWVAFDKRLGSSRGDVGIWHETYQARAGEYETVYSGMPPFRPREGWQAGSGEWLSRVGPRALRPFSVTRTGDYGFGRQLERQFHGVIVITTQQARGRSQRR